MSDRGAFLCGSFEGYCKGGEPKLSNFLGTYKGRPVYSYDGPFPIDPRLLILVPDRPTGRNNLRAPQRVGGKIKFGKEQEGLSLLDTITSIESNVVSVLDYHLGNLWRKGLPTVSSSPTTEDVGFQERGIGPGIPR